MRILCCTFLWFVLAAGALAQIQIGTLKGALTDPGGALVAGVRVQLVNPLTSQRNETITDQSGAFSFNNVPFNHYLLLIESAGFAPERHEITVRSNVPIELNLRLRVAATSEQITISERQTLLEIDSVSSSTTLSEATIERSARVHHGRQLQELVTSTPGWATENNGLIHVRGVDDGVLYVIDGIPIADRLDQVSAGAPDADSLQTMQVITGNFPAEFGGRSGAVVILHPRSAIDAPTSGTLRADNGDFRTGTIASSLSGNFKHRFGVFLSNSFHRSHRFLDPVDPRNFNNHGGGGGLNVRTDWHLNARDTLLASLTANGTNFTIPNDEAQQAAGQRQRQQLRDQSFSASWQRVWNSQTVSNVALFHRRHESRLSGSEHDLPLFAEQDRQHTRTGLLASVTHQQQRHIFKAGLEAVRIAPREYFSFFVTDEAEAEEREVSDRALRFDEDDPFIFRDRVTRHQVSFYAQDQFSLNKLTVQAGLRFDHTSLLVSEQQWSPRLGAVYFVPKTRTAIRASFNRLFQPPQVDNLLLSSSAQARALSPFVSDTNNGGAEIRPERVSAFEIGLAQDVGSLFKLDAAWWHRSFRNVGDPNVFFNTTIIFPNSVARGFSRGVDVRVDVPERRGWSGWLSYTNMRVLQIGPINGGLFLTDEFIEIGAGTRFIPDQDQRNTGAFGLNWQHQRSGLWLSLTSRHESGVPLEVDSERLEELKQAPGAKTVNFARGRVKPRTIFNAAAAINLYRSERIQTRLQFDVLNLTNRQFAYNFGNPFEGTHFGHGRRWSGGLKITIH